MCGLAGAVARRADPRVPRWTRAMQDDLAHRGPDGEGAWALGENGEQRHGRLADGDATQVALGHRRLSIVDVAGGAQPMSNEDGSIWVAYNGEIYNHEVLRAELTASGHRFRTRCDTEVLVHGWEEWGADLYGRLNGIFAFSLVDVRARAVHLVRDPMGVKPLYVGAREGITWWSSELRSAEKCGAADSHIDSDAVRLFLTFRFVPSPWAVFTSTWKVPPGHSLRVPFDRAGSDPRFESYPCRVSSNRRPKTRSDWRAAIAGELADAVERQLMSDVPVASLLSGGVDSAVVTRLMTQGSGAQPAAFAIGFGDRSVPDETVAAAMVARELGVPLTATRLTAAQFAAGLPEVMASLGEPVANPGLALVQLLCREVKRTHKVVLTGQGADEPLGGYPRHMAERLRSVGTLAPRLSAWAARGLYGRDAGQRLGRVLRGGDRADRMIDILSVIPPEDVDRVAPGGAGRTRALARTALEPWLSGPDDGDALNALLRVDARFSLADDLMMVADLFSMRASVELRVPFLDLAFVDLVERMPSRYKVSWLGERKWLYRQAARRILPRSTGDRLCGWRARLGGKLGFTTPPVRSIDGRPTGAAADMLAGIIDWSALRQASGIGARQRSAIDSLSMWSERVA